MKLSKIFKKEFWKLYLIDLACLILSFLLSYFSLIKISEYMSRIKSFNLDELLLQSEQDVNVTALSNYLEVAQPLLNKVTFLFILIFVGLFIFYNLSQALSWSKIRNIKFKDYIFKFCLLNIIFLVLLGLVIEFIPGIFREIVVLLLIYLLFICYITLRKSLIESIKKASLIGFKKGYILLLLFIGFVLLNLALIFVYSLFGDINNYFLIALFVLILILIFTLFKILLFNIMKKFE